MENVNMPLIGEDFPELEVKTTHGHMNLPEEYEGEWFVLFSHPGDFTPVCTSEFVSFQEHKDEFDDLDVNLIGLSVDKVHSHIKWTEWIDEELDTEIEFPIIADASGNVAEELGMLQPASPTDTVRAVFIVDPEGKVRQLMYYPEEVGRNIDEIVRTVKALKTSDREGVAVPGDWPENENFGDKVLLPPPGDQEGKKKRLQEASEKGYDCKDWWFCLKELE